MDAIPREQAVDVLVVGAGIVGASCAYHLAADGHAVAVVESAPGFAEGSTGRSFASVRGQWSDPVNIQLSWRSIERYRDFRRDHGIDVGYRPTGYLFLFHEAAWPEHRDVIELQRSLGVNVEVLDLPAARTLSDFDPVGIAGATWGPEDGQVDPHATTSAFLSLARARTAQVHFTSPVLGIDRAGDASWLVRAGDRRFRAQHVVNAAGGWSGEVAALAGMQVPVDHSRRNVYATAGGSCVRPVPLTIDLLTGIAVRSEGDRLIVYGGHDPRQPPGYDLTLDLDWMETALETASVRFPYLADMPLDTRASWAGTYDMSPDQNAIVGADPENQTWINACGFSGHGVMQAPEVGRVVAEQVRTGRITSVDAAPLSLARFDLDERPVPAGMVV